MRPAAELGEPDQVDRVQVLEQLLPQLEWEHGRPVGPNDDLLIAPVQGRRNLCWQLQRRAAAPCCIIAAIRQWRDGAGVHPRWREALGGHAVKLSTSTSALPAQGDLHRTKMAVLLENNCKPLIPSLDPLLMDPLMDAPVCPTPNPPCAGKRIGTALSSLSRPRRIAHRADGPLNHYV